ncbi:MAG: DUF2125 domain-containing protein [Parvularculaceae bacterium]
MTRVNRRYLYAPFLIAAILCAIWYSIWLYAAGLMRQGVADFIRNEAEAGYEVKSSPVKVSGFPFFLRGKLSDASIRGDGFSYSAKQIFLDALFYQPDRLIISPSGAQTLHLGNKEWLLTTTDARASIERDKARQWIAKLQTGRVEATHDNERIVLANSLANIAPDERDPATLDISLRIVGGRIALERGDFVVDRLDASASLVHEENDRSSLTIQGAQASVDDANIAIKGEVRPDAAGRAEGALDAVIERPTGLVSALEKAGALTPRDARTANAGVALLSAATGGVIKAPIIFKNGEVKLAGIKIAKAPKIGGANNDQP